MEYQVSRYKVLVVGNGAIGKTSFITRYVHSTFLKNYKPTLGVDFFVKEIISAHGPRVHLHMWDIQGQESAKNMTSTFYRKANAAIVMFDITQRKTFEDVRIWKRDIDNKIVSETCPCILLGNKSDLKGMHEVSEMEIKNLGQELDFIYTQEISVKLNHMVDESMEFLVKTLCENSMNQYESLPNTDDHKYLITDYPNDDKKCCQ